MNIILDHNLDYKIPLQVTKIVDKLLIEHLLHKEIYNNQYIYTLSKNEKKYGELIASMMREYNLKIYYHNGKLYSKDVDNKI